MICKNCEHEHIISYEGNILDCSKPNCSCDSFFKGEKE